MPKTNQSKTKPSNRNAVRRVSRSALVASIRRDVAHLVDHDHFCALQMVMESTGYLNNRTRTTSKELGAAIVALAGVLDGTWLVSAARAAAFERAFRRSGMIEPYEPGRWERADAAADAVCPDPYEEAA